MKTIILILVYALLCPVVWSEEGEKEVTTASKSPTPAPGATPSVTEQSSFRDTLDGVVVEAIDTYPNPRKNEFNFGMGIFPFSAYYNGFALNASYTHYYNQRYAWDVLNMTYCFPVDKSLSAELAEKYRVEPKLIERLSYVFSSNLKFIHSYGKLIYMDQYLKYYRSSLIAGAGILGTTVQSYITANAGITIDFLITEKYAWKFEVIDHFTLTNSFSTLTYIVFRLSTGISF
jgi:hypothetical protein